MVEDITDKRCITLLANEQPDCRIVSGCIQLGVHKSNISCKLPKV